MIQTIPNNLKVNVKSASLYYGLRFILILSKGKLTWPSTIGCGVSFELSWWARFHGCVKTSAHWVCAFIIYCRVVGSFWLTVEECHPVRKWFLELSEQNESHHVKEHEKLCPKIQSEVACIFVWGCLYLWKDVKIGVTSRQINVFFQVIRIKRLVSDHTWSALRDHDLFHPGPEGPTHTLRDVAEAGVDHVLPRLSLWPNTLNQLQDRPQVVALSRGGL